MLRLYTFGRMDSQEGGPATCIVAAPAPLPPPPAVAAAAAAAGGETAAAAAAPTEPPSAEERAAGTALPDEESDLEVRLAVSAWSCRLLGAAAGDGGAPSSWSLQSCLLVGLCAPPLPWLVQEEEGEVREQQEDEHEGVASAEAKAAATALPEESDFEVGSPTLLPCLCVAALLHCLL